MFMRWQLFFLFFYKINYNQSFGGLFFHNWMLQAWDYCLSWHSLIIMFMKLLHLCVMDKVKVAQGISGYIFLAPCCPVSVNLYGRKSFYGLFLWPGAKEKSIFMLLLDSFTFTQQDVSKHFFFSSGNGNLLPICAWLLCFISLDSKAETLDR